MSDCQFCPAEKDCHYPHKPCDCVGQRKFWTESRRAEYDKQQEKNRLEKENKEQAPRTVLQCFAQQRNWGRFEIEGAKANITNIINPGVIFNGDTFLLTSKARNLVDAIVKRLDLLEDEIEISWNEAKKEHKE